MEPVAAIPTPAQLLAEISRLTATLETLEAENHWLRAQFNLARHQRFGASSERTAAASVEAGNEANHSGLLFNEAEAQAAPARPEPTLEEITAAPESTRRGKTRGRRAAQLATLPVEAVRYELPEGEQVCPQCSGALHEMGQEVRREIKIVPAQAKVVEHLQVKYTCRHCALHETSVPVLTAPLPTPAFPNSLASASAVAYVMNQKFELALPLYRLEQSFKDLGLELSRQTMANWMLKGAALLDPVYDRLHQLLVARDILHADETVLQVLHEPGRQATTDSRMWVYCSGRYGPADPLAPDDPLAPGIILYDYQATRAAEHPTNFLKGFSGFLHVDGYISYEKVPALTLVGCWAHARRKFDEAIKTLPPLSRAGTPCASRTGLTFCNQLFKVERELRDTTPAQRHAGRQAQSVPIVHAFRSWLEQQATQALPRSPLGQAVAYCLHQWPKLIAFLEDGRLELDNNRCERAVKPFVIGRKNWLFSNTPQGARASAIIYSLVETARHNNLRPLDYLTLLLERLPVLDDAAGLDDLLPWAAEIQARCGSASDQNP
jgi:transposase